MEPIRDSSLMLSIEQTLNTKKDKQQENQQQQKSAEQKAKKSENTEEKAVESGNDVKVERRSGDDRRQKGLKRKRFNLRNKHDRRQSNSLSLTV